MEIKTVRDLDLNNKVIILRADLNVPVEGGKVSNTTRIDRLKPTIDYLCEHKARVVVISHFGRPKGQRNPDLSLSFLPPVLKERWDRDVSFTDDCVGPKAQDLVDSLAPGQIGLLENLRFHSGEKNNDPAFVKKLAALGDIYINDAFSSSHRAHASTEGLAHALPAGAGLLMEAELDALSRALDKPRRPVMAIVGGAKISTKLDLLGNLVEKMGFLALGGGMANTFLHAQGIDMKASLCEHDMADQARAIMEKAQKSGCRILLPRDGIAAAEFAAGVDHEACDIRQVPDEGMVLDIGPQSVSFLKDKIEECNTIVWNGPLGAFEIEPFDKGTTAVAEFVAEKTQSHGLISVAGGGDTVSALEKAGAADDFSYISTAGGAFLEWLEGKTLPGVAALRNQKNAA